MESWHKHLSPLKDERSGRKSRPRSEGRNSDRTSAKRTSRRMVWLCDGNAFVTCATCTTRWPMVSMARNLTEIKSLLNIGWVYPNYRERQIKNTSVWQENSERCNFGLHETWRRGGRSGDLMIADCRFGRIRSLMHFRQKIRMPKTYS